MQTVAVLASLICALLLVGALMSLEGINRELRSISAHLEVLAAATRRK